MIKIIGLIALALVCFVGTLAGIIAATGNLKMESLDRIRGTDKTPKEEVVVADPVSIWAKGLKDKEKELTAKEGTLNELELRIEQRRQELVTLKDELTNLQKVIDESLETSDADHEKRLTDVATSLAQMKAANAAKILDSWPSAEEVAAILRKIKDKDRGKILDSMNAKRATEILRIIQERKL